MSGSKSERRRKRRWGDAAPSTASTATPGSNGNKAETEAAVRKKTKTTAVDAKAKAAALQQSVSARLAALKAAKLKSKTALNTAKANATKSKIIPTTGNNNNNGTSKPPQQQQVKKAKVYDFDMTVTAPTRLSSSSTANKATKPEPAVKINPYLAHLQPSVDDDNKEDKTSSNDDTTSNILGKQSTTTTTTKVKEEEMLLDTRLAGGQVAKPRSRHRPLTFVTPGTFVEIGEKKRAKAELAAKSGFVSGRKAGTFVKSTGMVGAAGTNTNTSYYGSSSTTDTAETTTLAPRADALEESADGGTASTGGVVVIPTPLVMEWWDVELLPNKLKKEVVSREGKAVKALAKKRMAIVGNSFVSSSSKSDQNSSNKNNTFTEEEKEEMKEVQRLKQKCFITASITNSKTSKLIQHPVPVIPPNAKKNLDANNNKSKAPTLYLTKKEMKRQRKLRRAEQLREQQDLQAAGVIPPPEPRLTLSNFMSVLGDQAVMDPSKMEAKVMEQMESRRLKHEKMNKERQLTKEQRSDKRQRKLEEDTSQSVSVALFLVKDMSHRYHRTKVDLNAQQNGITGGVLECESPKLSLVICEGGPKAIKRYTRLMMVRMKWKGENFLADEESDNDEENTEGADGENDETKVSQKFNPNNTCETVWTGMASKRMFNSFNFQSCESSAMARKVLEAKGVAHFWDQVLVHASGSGETFNFKLGDAGDDDDDEEMQDRT